MKIVYSDWESYNYYPKNSAPINNWVRRTPQNTCVAVITSKNFVEICDWNKGKQKMDYHLNEFSSLTEAKRWADQKLLDLGYRVISSAVKVLE